MARHWRKPRALRPGDRIGVCAPSGPVDGERLTRGADALRGLGFEVRLGEGILERRGFTAGGAERRLHELRGLFEDDSLAAVFCARGGAGVVQLMPGLDLSPLLASPKPLVGYSDVTFLHVALNNAGLVTVHGPMVARELAGGGFDRDSLLAALTGVPAPYATEPDDLLPLRDGIAEGRLLGGCLSILAAGLGTPWALVPPEDEDVVLLLEDVDEPPYRIDRMLRQLRGAGVFERVRGVVLGELPGCSPALDAGYVLEDVVLEALAGLDLAVALGLSSGHGPSPNVSLPLGVRARLACEGGRAELRVLESAVLVE